VNSLVSKRLSLILRPCKRELKEDKLARTTIVFSPHQDDETLACGGTIIKKAKMGVKVIIVFITDGRRSHRNLISEDELVRIRKAEAKKAALALGLKRKSVLFLNFKGGEIDTKQQEIQEKTQEIIECFCPKEIFIPYGRNEHPEHVITNKAILQALKNYKRKIFINEYPVWFWHRWPWIGVKESTLKKRILILKQGIISLIIIFNEFRYFVDIKNELHFKKRALEAYRSQMTRLIPNSNWKTLYDVSNGEFLQLFFQSQEIFKRYSLPRCF
jgi:LmbE family N-acetylglucosaminyl deacetylase